MRSSRIPNILFDKLLIGPKNPKNIVMRGVKSENSLRLVIGCRNSLSDQ